jgi:hypothetical protein
LLSFSTRTDKKQPQAEKMSEYYKKYGNPNYGGKSFVVHLYVIQLSAYKNFHACHGYIDT